MENPSVRIFEKLNFLMVFGTTFVDSIKQYNLKEEEKIVNIF